MITLVKLRHTYASRLAMAGVNTRTLQDLLGHQTPAMTARYSHLALEHLQSAVRALDATGTGTGTGEKLKLEPAPGKEEGTP